jgi:hypothetical protein
MIANVGTETQYTLLVSARKQCSLRINHNGDYDARQSARERHLAAICSLLDTRDNESSTGT